MGIINTTPDSFYEGSRFMDLDEVLHQAEKMLKEGAGLLDVGGQSTRPGSERISSTKEIERITGPIKAINKNFPEAIISVDTYDSQVANAAVDAGASIINDISGGELDENMLATVARNKVPYICMHMKGTPATMQNQPSYENVTAEVLDYFIRKITSCRAAGIHDLIIDPGFGFGKTIRHNFQLLKNLQAFKITGLPVLAGLSRKSTIYKTLNISPAQALNGTTALNMMALVNGASILRVHDVKEAMETVNLYLAYIQS